MDVAVVGAGPAGAWAAYTLARRGARVTIFDPSHPREKPCGGGVTGRALALVGHAIHGGLPLRVIRTARFVDSAKAESAEVALDAGNDADRASLVVASRTAFDAALLAAAIDAGATIDRSRVTGMTIDDDGVRITTARGECCAAFAIGADGANSLVRRRVARPFDRSQLSIATGFFARGVTSDEIVIEIVTDPPGYIWSFPRPDHLAVGICAQADAGVTAEALRAKTARWIHTTRIAEGAPLEPYSWPIPSLDARTLDAVDCAGRRWLLVGDAAGLVDPITREGIYFALLSGQWAAETIAADRPPREYESRVRDDIGAELARAARFKAGFFRPAFSGLLIRALEKSAAIRAVMADLVAGRQTYRTLTRRLLTTFEVGLAWRVISGRSTLRAPARGRFGD